MDEFDIEMDILPLLAILGGLDFITTVFAVMYIIEPKTLPDSFYQTPFPAIIGIQIFTSIFTRVK